MILSQECLKDRVHKDIARLKINGFSANGIDMFKYLSIFVIPLNSMLTAKQGWEFIDKANDNLTGTPFEFIICGDTGITLNVRLDGIGEA